MVQRVPPVSLAGIVGNPDRDFKVAKENFAVNTSDVLLHDNPLRLWALITNDDVVDVGISFYLDAIVTVHVLKPNGSLLINRDMPWTREVRAGSLAGCQVNVTEVSISL